VHRRAVEGADYTVPGDLGDARSLQAAVAGVDAILHLAATTHARRRRAYEQANVGGTERLLAAARRHGIRRFVHVSTRAISALGGAYSESKRRAEMAVSASGLEHVIVRLPEVYGMGSGEGVDQILEQARDGRRILVVGDGQHEVCPVFVDDVLAPLAEALDTERAANITYTLAGPCMTVREFAETCARAFGAGARLASVPVAAVRVGAAVARVVPLPIYPDQLARLRAPKPHGSQEANEKLGFAPRDLLAGLEACGASKS